MNILYDKVTKHFNDPVLVFHKLGRLVGYYPGNNDEPALVIRHVNGNHSFHTDLSGLVFLDSLRGKNKRIDNSGFVWDDYVRVDSALRSMNCMPNDEQSYGQFSDNSLATQN